jgi:hypothetical protein
MTANLTDSNMLALTALDLVEAYAARDLQHVDMLLDLWDGEYRRLARFTTWIAAHMLTSKDSPADFLARLRAYIHNNERNAS